MSCLFLSGIRRGEFGLLFISPEAALKDPWWGWLKSTSDAGQICLLAIDEVHCMCTWYVFFLYFYFFCCHLQYIQKQLRVSSPDYILSQSKFSIQIQNKALDQSAEYDNCMDVNLLMYSTYPSCMYLYTVYVFTDYNHCTLFRGSSFRPEYLNLSRLRGILSAPVLMLTATATQSMAAEITKAMHLTTTETVAVVPDR